MPSRVAAGITKSLFSNDYNSDVSDGSTVSIFQSAKQYENSVVRMLMNKRQQLKRGNLAVSQLHNKYIALSLKQPTFNKYLQEYVSERAYACTAEVFAARTREYHVIVTPSYYVQLLSNRVVPIPDQSNAVDLCLEVELMVSDLSLQRAYVIYLHSNNRSYYRISDANKWDLIVFLSEVHANMIGYRALVCRAVYGGCAILPRSTQAL